MLLLQSASENLGRPFLSLPCPSAPTVKLRGQRQRDSEKAQLYNSEEHGDDVVSRGRDTEGPHQQHRACEHRAQLSAQGSLCKEVAGRWQRKARAAASPLPRLCRPADLAGRETATGVLS